MYHYIPNCIKIHARGICVNIPSASKMFQILLLKILRQIAVGKHISDLLGAERFGAFSWFPFATLC